MTPGGQLLGGAARDVPPERPRGTLMHRHRRTIPPRYIRGGGSFGAASGFRSSGSSRRSPSSKSRQAASTGNAKTAVGWGLLFAACCVVAGTIRAIQYVAESGCRNYESCHLYHSAGWDMIAFGWIIVLALLSAIGLVLGTRAVVFRTLAKRWRWRPADHWFSTRALVLAGILPTIVIAAALWSSGAISTAFERGHQEIGWLLAAVILMPTVAVILSVQMRRLLIRLRAAVDRYTEHRALAQSRRAERDAQRREEAAAEQAKLEAERREAAERQRVFLAQLELQRQLAAESVREVAVLRREEERERQRREHERRQTVEYRRAEFRKDGKLRWRVLSRDNYVCRICGARGADAELTVDHITPLIAGGSNDEFNLQTLCRSCNSRKGGRIT
jgi:5-methylcytosine-specific restriction endonuclease McrA